MKILYHHRTQAEDGQAVHIRSLIQAFRELDHEVREVALVEKTGEAAPAPKAPSESKRFSPWSLLDKTPRFVREMAEYAYSVPAARRLGQAQREFGADFIYERYAFGNSAGVKVSKKTGKPLILEVNSPMVLELGKTRGLSFPKHAARTELRIFRGATRIAVVSEVLAGMLEDMGVDRSNIFVTPNGVNLEHFQNPDREAAREDLGLSNVQGPVIGFVGYYRDWHRLDLVIAGLESQALRETHLVLVGLGPAEDGLRQKAKECGVTDRVHFAGPRTHARIPAILPAFDVGLVPAINPYASPLKLHEYMAAGIPSLAPDQPNLREVLTHNKDALLFAPDDGNALVDALSTLVGDDSMRQSLGKAAYQTILDRDLTWAGNARRVIHEVTQLTR